MSEPAPAPSPAPSPAPAPAPAQAVAPAPAPVVATKPEFLPADYWDDKAGSIKTDEFAKHYGDLTATQQKFAERQAAVPEKPEAYKVELKLPEGVTVPEGVKFDPSKDPRLPRLLKVAHAAGLDNNQVNSLVALDAQLTLETHAAETARVAAETKKLGDKATERIAGVGNWAKALKDKGDITADEHEEIRLMASTAAGVSILEKLIAKANGGAPGLQPQRDPPATPKTIAERLYPHLPSGLPPASARSA